jgi:hypothetical protein
MSPPKVAICIPSGDTCNTDFALDFGRFMAYSASIALLGVASQKSYSCVFNRNDITGGVIASQIGFEWLMWFDTDMRFPVDTLKRLLDHDKDIVGSLYNRRLPPHTTLGQGWSGDLLPEHGLCRMKRVPTGCLLVRRSVFDKLSFPWFQAPYLEDGSTLTEDSWFSDRCVENGIELWADMDLTREVGHIGYQTIWCDPSKQAGLTNQTVPALGKTSISESADEVASR